MRMHHAQAHTKPARNVLPNKQNSTRERDGPPALFYVLFCFQRIKQGPTCPISQKPQAVTNHMFQSHVSQSSGPYRNACGSTVAASTRPSKIDTRPSRMLNHDITSVRDNVFNMSFNNTSLVAIFHRPLPLSHQTKSRHSTRVSSPFSKLGACGAPCPI